jgi:hypothetical protein
VQPYLALFRHIKLLRSKIRGRHCTCDPPHTSQPLGMQRYFRGPGWFVNLIRVITRACARGRDRGVRSWYGAVVVL